MTKKNSQSGSVLFYIMIAVVLFAALGFAVSGMMRGGSGAGAGHERDSLMADEILGYAKTLREASQILRVSNNCEEDKFSFEHSPFDGSDTDYVNAAAPTDFSCHIFHPQGGGVGYQTGADGQEWVFTSEFYVDAVGSGATELSAVLHVNKSICEDLNEKLDVSNSLIENTIDDGAGAGNILSEFQGSFTGSGEILQASHIGKFAGCYKSVNSSGEDYTFYQVLLAR